MTTTTCISPGGDNGGYRVPPPSMGIATQVSAHAVQQAQRRGVSLSTLECVLHHHDRSRKLPGMSRALWIGRKGRAALIRAGFPVAEIERCRGVRLIVSMVDDVVLTVEHALARRRWV
jgi:hypothetical protein